MEKGHVFRIVEIIVTHNGSTAKKEEGEAWKRKNNLRGGNVYVRIKEK